MNQIDLTGATGKTIKAVHRLGESQCLVVFDDATYCKIEGSGDEDWDGLDTFSSFNLIHYKDLWPIFLELGLITPAQIHTRRSADALRDEQNRAWRRAQYETLKKEFEQ